MLTINRTVTLSPEQYEIIIEGMRNPMNSWDHMDSGNMTSEDLHECNEYYEANFNYHIGPKDMNLMKQLARGGTVHAKYRRMMPVWVTINAPLYWWKEFDTYKVGTVCNSCSTMHKIQAKEFAREDFSCERLVGDGVVPDHDYQASTYVLDLVIRSLNFWRSEYLTGAETGIKNDKRAWWQMIQLLPSSYNQKRTVMLNYEVLHNIYIWRKDHKLDEWHTFCEWICSLPYSNLITMEEN